MTGQLNWAFTPDCNDDVIRAYGGDQGKAFLAVIPLCKKMASEAVPPKADCDVATDRYGTVWLLSYYFEGQRVMFFEADYFKAL